MNAKTICTPRLYRTVVADCVIRNEIKTWFKKLIEQSCGPDIHVNYKSYAAHFNAHTKVEISGNVSQVTEAVEFIYITSEMLHYKLPWLSENTYYVTFEWEQDLVKKKLETVKGHNYDMRYNCTYYHVIGLVFIIFTFRPDLDETVKIEIDKIFKSFAKPTKFITYPKIRESNNQSTYNYMATHILTAFHGKFLSYLSLEDILSLEIANNGRYPCCDTDLDRDIQRFLRSKYPHLYRKSNEQNNLEPFRINEVLRYYIRKYHACLNNFFIPNILTADEINSLKSAYNISIDHHKMTHIDFKQSNDLRTVNFCAIYHYNSIYFLNCDPKYATVNLAISFMPDDSLDPLKNIVDFTDFLVKAQNNCSPQQSNSVIKWVTENFEAHHKSSLLLYEFNLNHVSGHVLSSLLTTMRSGLIRFNNMSFNLKTLILILEQSDQIWLMFRKCHINIEKIKPISINPHITNFSFYDMNIELNLLCNLKDLKSLDIFNCRILSTGWDIPTNINNCNVIDISYTNFNVPTLLRLLNGLQCVPELNFLSCNIISCDHFESRTFTYCNEISFTSMTFTLRTLFEIFENCEIQNDLTFINCRFCLESDAFNKFSLKPVKLQFHQIKFETPVLLTILEMLNNESEVGILSCCILPGAEYVINSNKIAQVANIYFLDCQLDIQTLFNILSKTSPKTEVRIDSSILLQSIAVYPNVLKNCSNLVFYSTKLSLHQLLTIYGTVKRNSILRFEKCKMKAESETNLPKLNEQKPMRMYFLQMTIESQIARPLLQTISTIVFDNCYLKFMSDGFLNTTQIKSHVIFQNIKFDLSANLNAFANFSPKSIIEFYKCHFEFTKVAIPNIVLQPLSILFKGVTFDLDILITIMERISDHTHVSIIQCNIQPSTRVFSKMPIKIVSIEFTNVNLEIETILCILKRFNNLSVLSFVKSTILCSHLKKPSCIKPKYELLQFNDMDIDSQIFQTIAKNCTNILVNNCEISPVPNHMLLNESVNFDLIEFRNTNYSSNFLKLLENVTGHFIVQYDGQLSNGAIVEICTKTSIFGERLLLITQNCTKSIYFELFAEFFRLLAFNADFDTEAEYDLPENFIPYIYSLRNDQYIWDAIKIKFVHVNDATVKVEFLKNGKPIDLFFELSDLPDDSADFVVDYY